MVGAASANQVLRISKEDGEKKRKDVLRSLFTKLMSASKAVISDAVFKLINRLNIKRKVFNPGSILFLTCVCICFNVVFVQSKMIPVACSPISSVSFQKSLLLYI